MRQSDVETCVLIVDDDVGFRTFLADVLTRAGYRVAEAASGTGAITQFEESSPDLIISDVQMIDGSGYEVCRRLRRELGRDIPFIFLSGTRTEAYDRVAGFEFGADDYLVKPVDPEELLARVRALLRRSGPHAAATANSGARARYELTPRELEVLQLLAKGSSQHEIAATLYLTPGTVGKHIERILKKLGAHSRAEAVARAHTEQLVSQR